ncbi:WD40-repeat-containing domain protein [Melanogaster broomeanus]|nr:WD40-repeat-containing domain protein [Melanogaster broomeanus]
MPIASPPTPAPSPGPSNYPYTDSLQLSQPQSATYDPANLSRIEFANLSALGPASRKRYLVSLLDDCTPSELLFISQTIAPMLRRDFLTELPPEIALHILCFIDDPKTLARASQVSKRWHDLVQDEWLWKAMCETYRFNPGIGGAEEIDRQEQSPLSSWRRNFSDKSGSDTLLSYRKHFQHSYIIMSNMRRGGTLLRSHRMPIATPDGGVVTSVALDSDRVIVGCANSKVHIYSANTGVLCRTLLGHDLGVWAVHLPSDLCCTSEGWGQPNPIVVSAGFASHCIYILRGHTSTIRCTRVLHNRPIAVTGSRDTTVRVWDIQKGRMLRILEGHWRSVRCLDVCGNRVVSGSYDATCRIWNVDTGKCLHVLTGHEQEIYSVAFDGVRVVSGGMDTTVRVWDANLGQCIVLLQGHTALVCQLQLCPTTGLLATGGSDGRVITFDLHNYTPLQRISAHDSSVTSLQFDSNFLITGGNDGRVRMYETQSGAYVRDLSERCESVWKVACKGGTCAVMCRRSGKMVIEIWTFRPRTLDF